METLKVRRHKLRESTQPYLDGLLGRVGWSTIAQILPLLGLLIVTPFLVMHLGADRFGLWSLLTTIVLFGTGLDGGLGATLLRWFGMQRNVADRAAVTKLATTAIVGLFVVIGTFGGVVEVSANRLSQFLRIDNGLQVDATTLLRSAPLLVFLPLVTNVFNALLQANGKFRAIAIRSVLAETTFVVLVLIVVPSHGLQGLILCALAQQLTSLAASAVASSVYLSWRSCGFIARTDARDFFSFAWRMQAASISNLVILESDGLVIAGLLPVRFVGIYAVGASIASAVRSLPLFAIPALYSHLVAGFDFSLPSESLRKGMFFHKIWVFVVVIYTLFALAAADATVRSWVGPNFELSALVATALIASNGVHLTTAVQTSICRVIGRPALEVTYSSIAAVTNLALSIPLALQFGLYGVLGATVFSQVLGTLYFIFDFSRKIHRRSALSIPVRLKISLVLGAAVTGLIVSIEACFNPVTGAIGLIMSSTSTAIGLSVTIVATRKSLKSTIARWLAGSNVALPK